MRKISKQAALAIAVTASLSAFSHSARAADVTLVLHGVNDEGGNIRAAICDKATFGGYSCPYKQQVATAVGDVTVVFHNIPAGDWAAIAIHDSNLNGKLDENFLGVPTEQFGFSNNPGFLHKPDFSESQFTVDKDPVSLSIDLSK